MANAVADFAWSSSDRKFFNQHPRRKFRLRPAFEAEIEDLGRVGHLGVPPEGSIWWVAVRHIRPGVRMRVPFVAAHHLPAESTEADARKIWHRVTHRCWKDFAEETGGAS